MKNNLLGEQPRTEQAPHRRNVEIETARYAAAVFSVNSAERMLKTPKRRGCNRVQWGENVADAALDCLESL